MLGRKQKLYISVQVEAWGLWWSRLCYKPWYRGQPIVGHVNATGEPCLWVVGGGACQVNKLDQLIIK